MASANPIYENVQGAPFKIGDRVMVIGYLDKDGPIGHGTSESGVVVALEYECGCGQSYPDDPLIWVQFPDGDIDEFWKEELWLLN